MAAGRVFFLVRVAVGDVNYDIPKAVGQASALSELTKYGINMISSITL